MNKIRDHYAKWNKPVLHRQVSRFITFVEAREKQNKTENQGHESKRETIKDLEGVRERKDKKSNRGVKCYPKAFYACMEM
jgi:hypothetical protein